MYYRNVGKSEAGGLYGGLSICNFNFKREYGKGKIKKAEINPPVWKY